MFLLSLRKKQVVQTKDLINKDDSWQFRIFSSYRPQLCPYGVHAQEWISAFRLLVIVNAQYAVKTFVTSLEVESKDLNCAPWSW